MDSFPNIATTGKGGKIQITNGDGTLITLFEMTKQASEKYRGKYYTNLIYKLGTGKTLVNVRQEMQPNVYVDCVVQGLDISPGAAVDTVAVSAGVIEADAVQSVVAANAAVALTRPASTKFCWNAIVVAKATGTITAVVGTDTATADEAELLDTYGTGAGQKPYTPVASLLLGYVALDSTEAVVAGEDIHEDLKEYSVDYVVLPNIGGARIQSVLPLLHTGDLSRALKFTGRYLDNTLTDIASGKDWSLNATTNSVTDQTLDSELSASTPGPRTFTFNQLATDRKAIDAVDDREGHCAIRLVYPGGFWWQSVATIGYSTSNNPTAMNPIAITGTCGDFPAKSS